MKPRPENIATSNVADHADPQDEHPIRKLGIAAFVAVTALALVAAVSNMLSVSGSAPIAPAMTASDVVPVAPRQRPAAPDSEVRKMRSLAAIVAKRYRIADDATQEVVEIAYREGKQNRLDPLLIIAVIAIESRFNPVAQSDGGAMGLMQVIPRYHVHNFDEAGRAAMLEPRRNIRLGARVLRQYVRAAGTEVAGLQRYNGTADDLTNAYASKVLAEKERLQASLRRAGNPT